MIPKSLLFQLVALAWTSALPVHARETEGGESEQVRLRGKVVDIYAELRDRHRLDLDAETQPLYGFKTDGGELYTLLKTRRSQALFADARLRERELILQGRRFPGTRFVEATFIQSVIAGVVHDVYYYCDICAIESLAPELCHCCREAVRLVEEPVKDQGEGSPKTGG